MFFLFFSFLFRRITLLAGLGIDFHSNNPLAYPTNNEGMPDRGVISSTGCGRVLYWKRLVIQGSSTNLLICKGNVYYIKSVLDYATLWRAFRNCFSFEIFFPCILKYNNRENHLIVKTIKSLIYVKID